MKKIVILTILFFSKLVLLAQNADSTIIINSKNDLLNIGTQVYLLEDKENKLTIEDIQKTAYQQLFKKSEQEIPNFNTTASKIWVKFTVANPIEDEIYLELAEALAWYIDFYRPNSEGKPVLSTQTGMLRPMQSREVATNFFLFKLSKNSKAQTYYFSIQSEFPLTIPLRIGTTTKLLEYRYPYTLFFGMFSGLLLVMFAYNLFIYFSVRDKIYLFYCGYLFSGVFILNFISGNYGYQWNVMSYFPTYLITFSMLGAAFNVPFLLKILHTEKKQAFFKIMLGVFSVYLFIGIHNLFTGHYFLTVDIFQLCSLLTHFYVFFYSIFQYLKGNKMAIFVATGFSFYSFGVIIFILQNFGVLPTNFFTHNSVVLGASIEVLMFSLALADRINTMRKEKEESQIALLHQTQANEKLIREQNAILEQMVREKTLDLQNAYDEIQVTNEELHQSQEEILSQRDIVIHKNEILEAYRHKISQSIASALLIQKALLPTQDKLDSLLKEYFILYRPKDIVSGDFYWANQIGNHKFLIVADCTGHGVSGAFMTMIGSSLLDRIINMSAIYEPHLILETLHQQIQTVLQQEKTGNTDGMDIIIVKWEEKEQHNLLDFAAAKRPLYTTSENKITKIAGSKKMIGGLNINNQDFLTVNLVLPRNTIIYLSTDGYADQNNKDRQRFSENRFAEILSHIQEENLPRQKEFLEQILDDHIADTEQRDDILIMGVRL